MVDPLRLVFELTELDCDPVRSETSGEHSTLLRSSLSSFCKASRLSQMPEDLLFSFVFPKPSFNF